ncbi:MAG TPA: hypothetical protein VEU30_06860 [Thermoanaerobaculia bacterium]|nr:hypothetical protein [Thermoanaerobaculia bacterium]
MAARYLDEVPPETVVGRLTLDGRIPRWLASLAVPVFIAIRAIERMRRTSDALVVPSASTESPTLVARLSELFPESDHVWRLGLHDVPDAGRVTQQLNPIEIFPG